MIKLLLRDGSGVAGDVRIQREGSEMALTVKLDNTFLFYSYLSQGVCVGSLKGRASIYLPAVVSFKAASEARVTCEVYPCDTGV